MSFQKLAETLTSVVEQQRQSPIYSWGTVTADDPLTVTLDADRGVIESPQGGADVKFGERVYVMRNAGYAVIIARSGGISDSDALWSVEQGVENNTEAIFEQGLLVEDHEERIKEAQELAQSTKEDVEALGPVIDDMDHALNVELPAAKQQASDAMSKAVESLNTANTVRNEALVSTEQEFSVGSETAPGTVWTKERPPRAEGQILWQRTTVVYGDGSTAVLEPFPVTGDPGAPGEQGERGPEGLKGEKGDRGSDGLAGKDGVGVVSTTISYAKSASATVAPTTGWNEQPPSPTKGQYLWTRTVWVYSDDSTETGYSTAYWATDGAKGADGIAGKDGTKLIGTVITYAQSTSGTTAPSSGWQASPPPPVAGRFIWTRTVWSYDDGTSETGYSVGKIGDTGAKGDKGDKGDKGATGADGLPGKDGVGLTGTTITYAKSSSATTAPTSGWQSQPPSPTKGQYLWTKTVWTYSDGSRETGYSTAYWATDGAKGSDGIAGKDGVGITDTTITYAQSTSGTTAPTSGWNTNPPAPVAGRYVWTKTVWTYSDGTTETGYSVGKIGDTGAQGKPGDPGEQGVGVESVTPFYAQYPYSPFAPGPGGYESVYMPNAAGITVAANTSDPTGKELRFTAGGTMLGPTLPLGEGAALYVKCYAGWRTVVPNTLATVYVEFLDADGDRVMLFNVGNISADVSTRWVEGTLVAPVGTRAARIRWSFNAPSNGGVRIFRDLTARPQVGAELAMPLPDQPSGASPGGIWQDTEPSYESGTVLFRTEQIKYTDGRVQYTPVTQSSSYQAAENALHVANLAQAAAEGLLTIGTVAPEHGPGKVWLETNEDGALTGVYQSVDGRWAEYTIITGVLIVPGEDGTPTVIDQNGMTIGEIWAESIVGESIAANTIGAEKLILADIGREYLKDDVRDTLGEAEAWADLTLLEPGKITITSKSLTSGELSSLILRPAKIDFLVRDQPKAYIDGEKNVMWIGNAKIDDTLHVGEHQVRTLEGTNITVFQWVGGGA